jgi:hypothetical protein
MTTASYADRSDIRWGQPLRLLRQAGSGFLFWLAFVLALEPGNVMRALASGAPVIPANEALRMGCAAALGAVFSPLALWLGRQLPVRGPRPLRNFGLLALLTPALALAMLFAAGLAAPLLPPNTVHGGLGEAVAANLLLLTAALGALVAWAQLTDRPSPQAVPEAPSYLDKIAARGRSGVILIDVGEIDWIEAQGNYLALHVGGRVHLVRETMTGLQKRLDPGCFARVHRGCIVNLDKVREIRPEGGGDARLTLANGETVRLSRSFRSTLPRPLPTAGQGTWLRQTDGDQTCA